MDNKESAQQPESDTPRTDKELVRQRAQDGNTNVVSMIRFARQLERELSACRGELEEAGNAAIKNLGRAWAAEAALAELVRLKDLDVRADPCELWAAWKAASALLAGKPQQGEQQRKKGET